MRRRAWRSIALTVGVLGAFAVASSAASAASIVFIKGGDVWLAAADGGGQRQLTTGGDWSYPSQADDGTIMAQEGERLYRLDRSGHVLAGPIDTTFADAPPGTNWEGPFGDAISPDGVNQAYDGDVVADPYYDPGCNCYVNGDHFTTYWGSASTFSQPNQPGLGQEDYVDPAWIDSSHLLLTAANDVGTAEVATYTLGDGGEVSWFTDNSQGVSGLTNPAITRDGDKLAFIADSGGGVENEIRLYQTTGPPPEAAGDPSNLPIDECNVPLTNFSSNRVSFSPDGQSLAFDAPDGIHLLSLTGWPSCQGFTDKLIIPGGSLPYFGPADVGAASGAGSGSGSGVGTGSGPGSGPNSGPNPGSSGGRHANAFSITHRGAHGGVITLTSSAREAGTFTAHASAKFGRGPHRSRSYGSASARLRHGGLVQLSIGPTPGAARALARARRMVVTIAITFAPHGASPRTKYVTVVATRA
jgi:WD40-like Beta Propeller Repeat